MKRILLILVYIVWTNSVFASTDSLREGTLTLIKNILTLQDSNPAHIAESEEINVCFHQALNEYRISGHMNIEDINYEKVSRIFELLYKNATDYLDDSVDIRRHELRQSLCFATISLLSDVDKKHVFLSYAEFYFTEDKPSDLYAQRFLGLYFMDLLYSYDIGTMNRGNIKKVSDFIDTYSTDIEDDIENESKRLIEMYKNSFNLLL